MTHEHAKLHPVLHSAHILEKRVEALLSSSDIRHRQALVLDALQQIGPTSQQHLAKQFGVSAGSMSSMIVRLLALGHITQVTNPKDRRRDIVDITSSGQSALRGVHEVWREGDRMIEAALGREKSEQFINLARELSKALGGGPPAKEQSD